MKILIVKLGAIGDVLRTTSILGGLQNKYPGAGIDWLTLPTGREMLIYNQYLNHVFLWDERNELEKYDLVIGLEDDLAAGELAAKLGVEKVLGAFAKDGKINYSPSAWFDMSIISKYGIEKANRLKAKNRKTFQQHMADLLGISVGEYVYAITPEEREYGERIVRGVGVGGREKIVGINTGAGKRWPQKSLSIEKTIDLVNKVKNNLGLASIILGGEEEKERNAIIAKETGMPSSGAHTVRNFAGIINRCHAIVASDSLAMHLAIAVKRKIAAFFGPTSAAEIELYGLGVKVAPKMDCLACYKKSCDKKPNCMDELAVEDLCKTLVYL
ncbi:MAG: glycosyltransferase family 9 protein [Candidatus Margulisbacteria bacterium]|nr:glycosyltransferase family 9 protein [Candidatus Margulisiibacteriota bacterium]